MLTDVSAVGGFVGLTASDTTVAAGLVNGLGFNMTATALQVISDNASTTVQTDVIAGVTPADGIWHNVAFYYDGDDTVSFYHSTADNVLRFVHKLNVSTTADLVPMNLMLTPTIEAVAIASADGSADVMVVDYVLCQQMRRRA